MNGKIKLDCNHIYHKKCFKKFIKYNKSKKLDINCPLCRKEIEIKVTKCEKFKNFIKKIMNKIMKKILKPILFGLVLVLVLVLLL